MKRREFLTTIERAGLGVAAGALLTAGAPEARAGSAPGRAAGPAGKTAAGHRFRLAMYTPELALPFDEELAKAKEGRRGLCLVQSPAQRTRHSPDERRGPPTAWPSG